MGMTTPTQIRVEGQPAFPVTDTENDNSAASSAGEETGAGNEEATGNEANAAEGADTGEGSEFHKHPAWQKREETWKTRFNDQEKRFQDEMRKFREELGPKSKPAAPAADQEAEIPEWFGGTLEQWKAYEAHMLSKAESVIEMREAKAREAKEAEESAVKDATDYLKNELKAIEADKELNPTGEKIDANRLLKFVLENNLIDTQNRWDYRKGFRFMKQGEHTRSSHAGDRKKVAGATTSESRAEKPGTSLKTREDFQKKRPW